MKMSRVWSRVFIRGIIVSFFIIFCIHATAEAASDNVSQIDFLEIPIEELMEVRIITVSSVTRFEQRITEAPASVSVIDAEDIRKYGYRDLTDILKSIPGLYVSNDRNYSYLGVRGFSRPGDYNTRVLLLIDGHRVNENIYDTAPIGSEFPLDVDLIDRVEFTRGPIFSIYGSNALFGVINVVTRKAQDVAREVSFAGGSNETWKGRGSYGAKLESGLEFLLSGSMYRSAGQPNVYAQEYAGDPGGPVFRDNDADASKSFYSRFTYNSFTLSGVYQTREKGIPTGSYGTVYNTKPNSTTDDRGYVDLSYRHSLGQAGDISARLFYDQSAYDGKYTYDKLGGPPYVMNRDQSLGRWWGAESLVNLMIFKDHHISFGGEFRDNIMMSQTNYDESPYNKYLDDNRSAANWGLFIQDEYRLFRRLLLNVGARYDHYNQFNVFNPRAALIYLPTDMTTLKLIYGEGFRAPNPYEMYYNDGGMTSKSNNDLKPEKIRTYEAIWEQYFGRIYNTSVSSFYYRIDDLISQVLDTTDNLMVFRNIDKVEAKGIELSLQAKWRMGLHGRLSYTWQEVNDVNTGNRLSNSPRQTAKGNISIPVYKSWVFVSPEVQYITSRQTLAGNNTKDTVLVNLTIFSRNLMKGLEASVSIYNLFDANYGDPGATEHRQDIINQDGINFRVKLTYRF